LSDIYSEKDSPMSIEKILIKKILTKFDKEKIA